MWKWFSSISNGNFTVLVKARPPSTPSLNCHFHLAQPPRELTSLPFIRVLRLLATFSTYSNLSWKIRLAVNFADSRSGYSTSTTKSITSRQNECTLASQSAVRRPEGVFDYNRHYVNDLPTTSPHGCYSEHDAINAGLAADPDATRGTPMAHCNTYMKLLSRKTDHCSDVSGDYED